jgi:hypothetical protein
MTYSLLMHHGEPLRSEQKTPQCQPQYPRRLVPAPGCGWANPGLTEC